MNIMNSEVFYRKYIEKDFEEHYVPHLFENICKQYLIRKNKEGEIEPVIEKIGKYYYDNPAERSNGEFDILTEDELGYTFYEVKFQKKQIFFSRSGFRCEKRETVKLIELKELFDETDRKTKINTKEADE